MGRDIRQRLHGVFTRLELLKFIKIVRKLALLDFEVTWLLVRQNNLLTYERINGLMRAVQLHRTDINSS